ncbi:MAG: penicillin-binding transpeptidase domain-containing protein, partial [Deinococcota bacterium]
KVPGFAVAGKSGTADIFDHDAGRYIEGDYTMSFAGIFPADEPKVTALVYLQKPRVGTTSSLVATPIFRVVGSEAIARWGLAPRE